MIFFLALLATIVFLYALEDSLRKPTSADMLRAILWMLFAIFFLLLAILIKINPFW